MFLCSYAIRGSTMCTSNVLPADPSYLSTDVASNNARRRPPSGLQMQSALRQRLAPPARNKAYVSLPTARRPRCWRSALHGSCSQRCMCCRSGRMRSACITSTESLAARPPSHRPGCRMVYHPVRRQYRRKVVGLSALRLPHGITLLSFVLRAEDSTYPSQPWTQVSTTGSTLLRRERRPSPRRHQQTRLGRRSIVPIWTTARPHSTSQVEARWPGRQVDKYGWYWLDKHSASSSCRWI